LSAACDNSAIAAAWCATENPGAATVAICVTVKGSACDVVHQEWIQQNESALVWRIAWCMAIWCYRHLLKAKNVCLCVQTAIHVTTFDDRHHCLNTHFDGRGSSIVGG
jgi:hypothetical protein